MHRSVSQKQRGSLHVWPFPGLLQACDTGMTLTSYGQDAAPRSPPDGTYLPGLYSPACTATHSVFHWHTHTHRKENLDFLFFSSIWPWNKNVIFMISYILAVDSETSLLTHTDPHHTSLLWDLLYAFMNKRLPRLQYNLLKETNMHKSHVLWVYTYW